MLQMLSGRQIGIILAVVLTTETLALATLPLPPLKPGPARPWESEVQVSTYSRVNTLNGNLFTAIPLFSWGGVGPDMNMVLYHNSANWNQTGADTLNVGFFLGPGWSISYGDYITLGPPTAIHGDGTRDVFTSNGQGWVGPPGVHDVLTVQGNIWRLTHKDQSVHEFEQYDDSVIRIEENLRPHRKLCGTGLRGCPNPRV